MGQGLLVDADVHLLDQTLGPGVVIDDLVGPPLFATVVDDVLADGGPLQLV